MMEAQYLEKTLRIPVVRFSCSVIYIAIALRWQFTVRISGFDLTVADS